MALTRTCLLLGIRHTVKSMDSLPGSGPWPEASGVCRYITSSGWMPYCVQARRHPTGLRGAR